MLKKVKNVQEKHILRDLALDNAELLLSCGFNKPIRNITDKVDISHTVALHMVILSCLGELTAFKEGLKILGVLKMLEEHSSLMHDFFCNDVKDVLTSGTCV